MVKIIWSKLAKLTLFDETNFILSKWNETESEKFLILVYDFIETLSKAPEIGKYNSVNNHYSFVISKQTTLYYKYDETLTFETLILFWNNTQNPALLKKYLKKI